MANVPQDLKYTSQHEYLKPAGEDGVFYVGITDFAQGELGDIVFVELPKPGSKYDAGAVFGTINSDPYGEGWMIKVRADDAAAVAALLDAAAYEGLIG
jgi:glycine cleavage system H protein